MPVGHGVNLFLAQYGLLALFLLAFIKAIGIPIPIPADLVVLAAAGGSAGGKFVLWQAFLVLLVAMVGGAIIQYSLARGPGRNILYRYGRHIGLTPDRLDSAFARVENVNFIGVGVAVITPGLRTAAIPACGIAAIPIRRFVLGLFTGTAAYLIFQFTIGFAATKLWLHYWNGSTHVTIISIIVAVSALFMALIVWHRSGHGYGVPEDRKELGGPFRNPACPICLSMMIPEWIAGRRLGLALLRWRRGSKHRSESMTKGRGTGGKTVTVKPQVEPGQERT